MKLVAVASSTGTIHVFDVEKAVKNREQAQQEQQPSSAQQPKPLTALYSLKDGFSNLVP